MSAHVDVVPHEVRKLKATLTIEVSIDDVEFVNPAFRYRFLDGSKKITPPIGTPAAWIPIAPDGTIVIATANTSQNPSSARQTSATSDSCVANEVHPPKYFRHEQHAVEFEVSDAFLHKLHDAPTLTFFLSDQSTTLATAVTEHNQTTTPGVGRNYITFFELDASPLLGGDQIIEQQWGYESPSKDIHLPLGVPMINGQGIRSLLIRLKVDHPLLTPALSKDLLPLTICLRKVSNLPGITVQSKSLLQYITPTPHTALHKCCLPTYASMRLPFFPQRIVRTSGILQDSAIAWQHKTTFLCTQFEWLKLQEALSSGNVHVEVHDRDVQLEKEFKDLVKTWESYIGGKLPPDEQHHTKALDIFQVDELAKLDIQKVFYLHAGDKNSHGLAAYRLNELLNTTSLLKQDSTSNKPFMNLHISSEVVQQKRRMPPKEGTDEDINLSQVEKLVRMPGAYLNCMTSMGIHATLQHPLHHEPKVEGGFTRMVVIFPYNDVAVLQMIAKAIESVNTLSLPGVSLRSYQLTPQQKQACECGELNLITGFQVIDSHFRMIFMEGIADKGMATVYSMVPRTTANSKSGFRMFANLDVRFNQRLYTPFDVDLKRIKLRDPLPDITKRPELYRRSKVSENCFQALNRLSDVRKADRLLELKNLDLFPTVQMLLEVESKYGESITLEDIHGHASHDPNVQLIKDLVAGESSSEGNGERRKSIVQTTSINITHVPIRLKAETDAKNEAFELAKKNYKPKDYLDERRQEVLAAAAAYAETKANDPPTTDEPVYIYSGQKLRTKDLEKDAMRQRLAKDRNATFTYSKEFNSLTVGMVDETKLALLAEEEARAKYTTPSGFVYPAPRHPSEFYKHKDAPSAARCEELHAPWIENLYHPQPLSRDNKGQNHHKVAFDSLPSKDMVFGGTNADGSVNQEFFKSVHLVGDGLAKEMEEAKAKEHQEWLDKLVVDKDNLRFIAHGNIMGQGRDKPSPLDKPCDILAGTVRSKPLRIVRGAKLPSGKRVPLQAMPVSIMNQDEYKGGALKVIMRDQDSTQFISKNEDGQVKDFLFPSVTQILVPDVNKHTTLLKPRKPLHEIEKTGLRWKNPHVNQDTN